MSTTDDHGLRIEVFTSPFHDLRNARPGDTFSPTTSTLVIGESEVVLVDAQHIRADVLALGDAIERTGKTLTTIYVTHSHADHWFGAGELVRRFPQARTVALPSVVQDIKDTVDESTGFWADMFGEQVVAPGAPPEALDGDTIDLDGHVIKAIEVEQGDINPNSVVHIPSIGTVIAGDVVYNQIHAMLGLSGPDEWARWIDTIDRIARLEPATIVAGHKKPDAPDTIAAAMLARTREYVTEFAAVAPAASTADELIAAMTAKFPDYGNPWTLWFSAGQWFAR